MFRLQSRLAWSVIGLSVAVCCLSAGGYGALAKGAKAKDAKACVGVDMLAELRKENMSAYSGIMAEAARTKNDGAVLWRISKADREDMAPSYLMGTLHLSDPRITKLSPNVEAALFGSRLLALEVADESSSTVAQMISKAADLVTYPAGQRLSDVLTKAEFAIVRKQLGGAGLPVAMTGAVKPWVVSLIMAVSACERTRVSSGKPVLDIVLARLAREQQIPVVGLETIESQLLAVASVPIDEQLQALRTELHFVKRRNDLAETLVQLYLRRRIGAAVPFRKLLGVQAGHAPELLAGFTREIIVKRNRTMRTRLMPLLGKGGAFVAVGALHLVGEEGLVALVRRAGYDVVPVE